MTKALTILGLANTAAAMMLALPWWCVLALATLHVGGVVFVAFAEVALRQAAADAVPAAERVTKAGRGA